MSTVISRYKQFLATALTPTSQLQLPLTNQSRTTITPTPLTSRPLICIGILISCMFIYSFYSPSINYHTTAVTASTELRHCHTQVKSLQHLLTMHPPYTINSTNRITPPLRTTNVVATPTVTSSSDRLFTDLVFWSTDYHISPIADLKYVLADFGIEIIDKSLSGACGSKGTCAHDLKVLTKENAYHIGARSDWMGLSRQLFTAYQNDPEFERVDAIVCFHPIAICQLYIPFNKSIIMISSTRYEHGQEKLNEWTEFNQIIGFLASQPHHIVGGNNLYDAEYLSYFTGIPTLTVPSFCGDITPRYHYPPSRPSFLIGHSHVSGSTDQIHWDGTTRTFPFALSEMEAAKRRLGAAGKHLEFVPMDDLYPRYEYSDLAQHSGLIHFPYQVSVMSFFEQYRMNIPMFFPSLEFFVQLHREHHLVSERTWAKLRQRGLLHASDVPKHPSFKQHNYDPNDDFSPDSIRYWLGLSDYYHKPHIIYFDSFDDLMMKLLTTDLKQISLLMQLHNVQFHANLQSQWSQLLTRIDSGRPLVNGIRTHRQMPDSFEVGMGDLLNYLNQPTNQQTTTSTNTITPIVSPTSSHIHARSRLN